MSPNQLYLSFCGTNGFPLFLETAYLSSEDVINHVVVSVSYSAGALTAVIYINGAQSQNNVFQNSNTYNPAYWRTSYNLNLFGVPHDTLPWPGQLYFLAAYDQALTPTEVLANFNVGIPSSLPSVTSAIVSIKENGEDGTNHYSTPSFYSSIVPSDQLQKIILTAFALDEQLYCRYACKGVIPGAYLSINITSFPTFGQLFQYDGSLVNSIIARNASSGLYVVRYRPPWNQISTPLTAPLDSFAFAAIDGSTGLSSSGSATLDIIVFPVVKPPQPLANNLYVASANKVEIITLGGIVDPISNATISSVNILTLPANGLLYQVYPNNTVSTQLVFAPGMLLSLQTAFIYS